jgi:signal peptidase II
LKSSFLIFLAVALCVFVVDQAIKYMFVFEQFYWWSDCISLELHYNRGVAFSMLAFLGDYLKWIQLGLMSFLVYFIVKEGYVKSYSIPAGLLVGAALSNLSDRFVHGGVVDYVAWHCGFDFAVFNFADVMIDVAIGSFLIYEFWLKPKSE